MIADIARTADHPDSRTRDDKVAAVTTQRTHSRPTSLGITNVLKALVYDLRFWFQKEAELLKIEVEEKISHVGRSIGLILGGALGAFAGAIVLLIAVSEGLGALLTAAGIGPVAASFLASAVVGGVTVLVAIALLRRGLDKLSIDELKPERTAESLEKAGDIARRKTSNNHES